MKNDHNFIEVQKFNQWWLWVILLAIGILPTLSILSMFFYRNSLDDTSFPKQGIFLSAFIILAVIYLFLVLKLKTVINQHGIKMQYFPFVTRKIDWNKVKNVKVINYGFVGGWGIRIWTKYGTVYNVKGNKGLEVKLKNGNKFIIGTQKETELKSFLEELSKHQNINYS